MLLRVEEALCRRSYKITYNLLVFRLQAAAALISESSNTLRPHQPVMQFITRLAGLQVPFVWSETHELPNNSSVPIFTTCISTTGSSPTTTPLSVGRRPLEIRAMETAILDFCARIEFLRKTGQCFGGVRLTNILLD